MSPETAEKKGLRPLAGPYRPKEAWMLDNVLRDLRDIEHAIVERPDGLREVWRTGIGWKELLP